MIFASEFPPQDVMAKLRNVPDEKSCHEIAWPDVVVSTRVQRYSKQVSESAFSLLSIKGPGVVNIKLGKREFKVCEETVLVINPFQSLEYNIDEEGFVEVCNIHLSIDSFQNALCAFTLSDNELLDKPFETGTGVTIGNHLHHKYHQLSEVFESYRQKSHEDFVSDLIGRVYSLSHSHKRLRSAIPGRKESTREELFTRMMRARDIIFSNYHDPRLSIDALSAEVSMSKFHFLRVFRESFGYTPHKLIQQIRIQKAIAFMKTGELTIKEIALKVGFEEPNSIFPLIRKFTKQQ